MNIHPSTYPSAENFTPELDTDSKSTTDRLNHSLAHREHLLLNIQSEIDKYQRPHAEVHRIYAVLREIEGHRHWYSERDYWRVKEGLLDRQARQRMGMELARYNVRCLRRVLMEVKQRIIELEKQKVVEDAKRSSGAEDAR